MLTPYFILVGYITIGFAAAYIVKQKAWPRNVGNEFLTFLFWPIIGYLHTGITLGEKIGAEETMPFVVFLWPLFLPFYGLFLIFKWIVT